MRPVRPAPWRGLDGRRDQRGAALVVALILLMVIGLTAAATLRRSATSERVVDNLRLEALAHEQAEAGLRFCEAELGKGPDSTYPVVSALFASGASEPQSPSWKKTASWSGTAAAANSITVPPASGSGSAQCLPELTTLPDGKTAYLVTARGFSPGYDEAAQRGAVVWLQSTLSLD